MNEMLRLYERPLNQVNYMIAGWEQWADAGENSSGLPAYLIEQLGARRVAEIKCDECYLFQMPGTHHLMRPQAKHKNGHCVSMSEHRNELWFTHIADKGLFIFLGEEPHLSEKAYADAFFDLVQELNIRRVVGVGGVYGAMPFEKEREVSCVYSLPRLRQELSRYAVRFSNYEGGTTIGSYMAHRAELRGVEMVVLNAFSPAYEFVRMGITVQAMRVEEDWKSWYDLMRPTRPASWPWPWGWTCRTWKSAPRTWSTPGSPRSTSWTPSTLSWASRITWPRSPLISSSAPLCRSTRPGASWTSC